MRSVRFINQYFWPDMGATAQLLTDLAKDLSARGLRISILAGTGSYAPGREGPLPSHEKWKETRIRRVWCTNFGRASSIGRIVDYLSFLFGAAAVTLLGRRQDVVVCLSTPPLVALLGLVAKLRGSVFIYKVEDLYPDVAVAIGVLRRGSLSARFFDGVSRAVLKRADAVVALDDCMRKVLEDRGARRVSVIPNWADGGWIPPDLEAGQRFRSAHDLEGRFVVLYSGNMGKIHQFDAVLGAAGQLAETNPEVLFLFVGTGPRREEIRAASERLPNVRLLPLQTRPHMSELFNGCNLHLVILRPEVSGLLVPSKYSSALSVGKPVLLVGSGCDLETEIRTEGLGWTCGHVPDAVAAAVREAALDPDAAEDRGRRGRRLFESKYDRPLAIEKWSKLVGG